MTALRIVLLLSLALVASCSEDVPKVTDLDDTISKMYVTCETTWSCENCYTLKLCLAPFWWNIGITYYQCPVFAPYCELTASGVARCSATAPDGCKAPST